MEEQLYQLALSPDLDLTAEAFIAAWNAAPEARALAEAHLSTAKGTNFFDPLLTTVLLGIGTNVASSAIYDVIKAVIERARAKRDKSQTKHTHIEQIKKPDGTRILVVDIDE